MKWTNRTRPKSTPIGVELRARWARRGDGNRARPRIRFHNQPPALGPWPAVCALRSRRERGDRLLRFIAGPESQVICRYVDDHCQHNEKSSHPEKGAVMHPFPIRTVRRVFGVVGSAVLLEFGIIHGRAIDSSGRPKSPTIFCRAATRRPAAFSILVAASVSEWMSFRRSGRKVRPGGTARPQAVQAPPFVLFLVIVLAPDRRPSVMSYVIGGRAEGTATAVRCGTGQV